MFVYIHLPFCTSICPYCDFPKLLYDKKFVHRYLDSLEKEIRSRYHGEVIKSIYVGGGTPTSLEINELRRFFHIIKIFHMDFSYEFTFESNIESLNLEKIQLLKENGVNRISLGVQSFQDSTLKELGRHHTKEDVYHLVQLLKLNGFSNLSIDYIYGVHDNIQLVKEDIHYFLELDIPHISCYSLIIEEGTIYYLKNRQYISEDVDEDMYLFIESTLKKNGYIHYEVSNYAKEGYQSIHNLNYWNNGEYYGFGLGAVSYYDFVRRTNTRNLSKYLNGFYSLEEKNEDIDTSISNTLILGLRKIEGININYFYQLFHRNIFDMYDISKLVQEGYLEVVDDYLRIPSKYLYISNNILIHFV